MSKYRFLGIFIAASLVVSGCAGRLPRIQKFPIPAEELAKANAAVREGDVLLARGDNYAALLKYLEAAKLNPFSEVIYNKLAIAYTKLNYYDRALDAINRSIALNRRYAFGYNTLGTIDLLRRRPASAIKNFQHAINFNPGIAFFHLNLANAHLERNEVDKAMAALRRALTLDPQVMERQGGIGVQSASVQFNDSNRYYFLARVYAEQDEEKLAIDFLRKALSGGFEDFERLKKDKGFDKLRQTQEFKDLLQEYGVMLTP
ncbi:MAG: tetratricopeptide repeat protein [Acidobacteria bacterium]|nr:tetratricopeptide repeat protein [Acidobacteriota bacterium]